MLFSEIYGNYYRTAAHILRYAVAGNLDRQSLYRIVQEEAFGESMMTIPDAFLGGTWGLLTEAYETPVEKEPAMPLTTLEKRWMKALLLDPRIQLFQPDMAGLEEIQPLFRPEWLVYYDRYTDGDPFTDLQYIQNFRCILEALQKEKKLEISFTDGRGFSHQMIISPEYLEYSEKDDRFRLRGKERRMRVINLARIETCRILEETAYLPENHDVQPAVLTLELKDERNTLERFLLHFSHLKKETKRMDEKHYQIRLYYDQNDETEMLIRILSFGPMIQVLAPADFRAKLCERVSRQLALTGTFGS